MTSTPKERYGVWQTAKRGMSFLVPAYNEEESIISTLSRLAQVLPQIGLPYEIILVNDGSTDRTGEFARQVPDVRIIEHPLNIGYGNSIKDALLHAQYDWIGMVDADGSYPIEELPLLVQELHKGFDMVVAKRMNLDRIDTFGKRIARALLRLLVNFLNDRRIEDPNSGYRVMRRSLLSSLMPFLCGTFSFTTSLTILASGLAYFIKYVPMDYNPRIGRSKVRHFRDSLRTLQYVAQGIIFFNPIKFYLLLAIFTICLVFLPSLVLLKAQLPATAFFWLISGTISSLFLGMAALGDIIRLSSVMRNEEVAHRLRSDQTTMV